MGCGCSALGCDENLNCIVCSWNLRECNDHINFDSSAEKFAQGNGVSRQFPTWACLALTAFLAVIVVLLLTPGDFDRGQETVGEHDFDRCTCDGFVHLPRSQCHCARGGCERR